MNKKLLLGIIIPVFLFGQFQSFAEPSQADFIELPENLVEPYETILDTIESNKKLIEMEQSGIDKYYFLSISARAKLKTSLSDFSTELTTIDNEFRSPANTDFPLLITTTREKLTDYQRRLNELNINQHASIIEELYLIHLDEFKDTIRDINQLMQQEVAKDKKFDEVKSRLEIVDDQIEKFEQDKSESNWARIEEKIKQLKETIDEIVQ